MKAKLVKRTGEEKVLSLIFSWGYFFLGPIYYLFNKFIGRFLLYTALYVFGIWKDAGVSIVKLLTSWGINEKFVYFLEIPGKYLKKISWI